MQRCVFIFLIFFFVFRDVWPNTLNVLNLGKHAVSVSDWSLAM